MKKFEYKTVLIAPELTFSNEKIANSYNVQITAHANNGWELVTIAPYTNKVLTCVFKEKLLTNYLTKEYN